MPLERLPADLRGALLEFYFERNEDVPLADALAEFLHFVSRWSPSLQAVATVIPMPDGWVGLASGGERYAGTEPCSADFGRPGQAELSAREPIVMPDGRAGWLTLWGDDAAHVALWKRMEEQLLARYAYAQIHHHYQALVDAAVDAIITIDGRGIIRQFNPGACRMFGYTAAEMVGQSVNGLMPQPYSGEHDGYLQRYARTGERRIIGIGRRVPARRKDGSIFPAHLAVTEFHRDGEAYFIGTLRDISEFVEARSRASVEVRRHLSRELHDSVSQALFGIVLGAQAVKNALNKPEQAGEAIDYVLNLAESGLAEMRTLIFELRPEALESEGLLVCLRRQTEALARRYRLSVELTGLSKEPALELPLKHELYRVVMEALHNVVKHAQATRCVVRLQRQPGEYRITVDDDGCGFDPAAVSVSGVGLSSMRERVAQLGGRMALRSAPGEGTCLTLLLPSTSD